MVAAVTLRSLAGKELRLLRNQRATLVRRRKTNWRRAAAAFFLVCGPLALLTLWAEGKNPQFVLGFWTVLGLAILVPAAIQESRELAAQIAELDFALEKAQGEELTVASQRFWEFEEQEDEGACYAFELRSGGVVFVAGQDFYAGARFPSLDFSIVEVRDRKGAVIEMFVDKRGEKTAPERRVPAKEKAALTIPENRTFFHGTLEEVFESLRKA